MITICKRYKRYKRYTYITILLPMIVIEFMDKKLCNTHTTENPTRMHCGRSLQEDYRTSRR